MKKLPKILTIIFFSIFILQMVGLIFLLTIPQESQAATANFKPEVSIPGSNFTTDKAAPPSIAKYIQAIYNYAIGIVGILAAVVLMFGGVRWLTAGGSPDKITDAKAWIGASLSGLVLALASYMILNTINPDLVNLKDIAPPEIKPQENYSGNAFDENGNPKAFCCQGQLDIVWGDDKYVCDIYQYLNKGVVKNLAELNTVEIGEAKQWIVSKETCKTLPLFTERFNTAYSAANSKDDKAVREAIITVMEISATGGCNTETGKCVK